MNIDKQTVEDIRFLLRQIISCPAKRRVLEALRIAEANIPENEDD